MKIEFYLAVLGTMMLPSFGVSAPPILTYIYPAGAKLGSTTEVTLGGGFPNWPVQVWCSESRIEISASKEKGKLTVKVPPDVLPRSVWIRIHDSEGASAPRPFVIGRLPEVSEIEPNDLLAKAHVISGNMVVNGRLNKSGDVDHYRVSLKKGETLVASLVSSETILAPTDSVMQLLNSAGFVVAHNHDTHGLDPQIICKAPNDGEVVVRIFGFPAQPDSTIGLYGNDTAIYRLTLTTGPFVDHTIPLAVNPKQPNRVRVQGWNIPKEMADLPVENGVSESWINHPSLSEIHSVASIDEPTLTTFNGDLTPPFAITRQFVLKDETQSFSIVGRKGQPLHISAHSRQMGLMVTPVLLLRNAKGETLAKAVPPEINTDCELRYTPTVDGVMLLDVRDQFGLAGPRSTYMLRVRAPKPDFSTTLATDRISIKSGGTLDLAVTVTRLDGLVGDLIAEGFGLPAGISLKVIPQAKGKEDGKTVNVQFKAEANAKSGAIKLKIKSAPAPELSKFVQATVPEHTLQPVKTEHLWLNVTTDPPAKAKK